MVTPVLHQRREPGHLEHLLGVRARRHHHSPQPGLLGRLEITPGAFEHPDAVVVDAAQDGDVLLVAEPVHRLLTRRIVRLALGQRDAARGEEVADTVGARLAVHVGVVLVVGVEGDERGARLLGVRAQEVVEHLLPRRRVHRRGIGQHPIEIEQADSDLPRQPQHRSPSRR
jgi:hypothetical protein